jgi:hypothetical protein
LIVVGAAVGAWLVVRVFRERPRIRHPGIMVGGLWLAINLGLDLLILVRLTGMSLAIYATEIGLRYLIIPIMAVAIDSAGRSPRPSP